MEAVDGFSSMSKAEILRGIVAEKLTTAAQEILAVVERTVAGYEEEASGLRQEIDRQRRQLEDLLQPRIKLETIDDQFPVCEPAAGGGGGGGGGGGAELPEEEEQHKYEPNDQFPVCEPTAERGGGAEAPEEEEQLKYQLSVEDSGSLGLICYSEAQMEEDEEEEEDQERPTEPEYQVPSRLLTPTVQSDRRSAGRPRISASQDHIDLRIRVLEDSQIKVLSVDVYKKYPLKEVRCPRGLQEADFLDLLRSTFPQLAAQKPFDVLIADRSKTLQPLGVEPLTPEEIYRSVSTTGHSALYIRLKTQEEEQSSDEEYIPPQRKEAVYSPSTPDQTRLLSPRVQSGKRKPGRPRISDTQNHVDLRIRILEDSHIDVLTPNLFQMYPMLELQCPRGLQEEDFLHLLRSTFPQLAARKPFDLFTIDRTKRLQPLRVETMIPEEIHRKTGYSALYIRLKPPEEVQTREKEPLQRKDAATDSPSTDQTSLNTRVQSDRSSSGRPRISEPQNHVDLRICILEDSRIDVLSVSVYKKYPLREMQCPRGLQEADFLDLLRSTFPQLAAQKPFDFFLTDRTKRLQPLRVKTLTPEEIYGSISSTGHSALYIRLKAQEEDQSSEEELHHDAVKHSSSTSDQTRMNMSETAASTGLSECSQLLPSSFSGEMDTEFLRIMDNVSQEIRKIICKTLPNLCEETQRQIMCKLQSSGLESKDDLIYVRQEDIGDLLPVVQLRKLLNAFKLETETVSLDLPAIPSSSPLKSASSVAEPPSPSSGTHSSPSQLTALFSNEAGNDDPSSRPSTPIILKTWPETFQVPWKRMPQEIRSAIVDGRRPKPAERRQMVRVLVDEMKKFEEHPTRSQCLVVVRNIIRKYPKSFADMTPDGFLLGGGYTSLLVQVKNRVDNVNRGFIRHRAPRSSSTYKRRSSDTYECTRFEPELPPEETDDTMEQNRQRLEEIYRQEGADGVVRADVKNLMALTFCLQRCQINTVPPPHIEEIKSNWPFLFTQTNIYAHFELLTDVNVLRSLELAMEECGSAITEYFRGKPTNSVVGDVLSNGEDSEMAFRVVQLLMAHFEENLSGLVLLTDVSATAADVETTLTLPASPRLVLLGGTGQVTIGHWMITLEGRVICEGNTPTFLTGLAAVFAMFYILNLQYQEEAACTLEFIQRRFIGINPEKAKRGKVVSKKTGVIIQKKCATVNANVSTLLKNLIDFEWDFI